MDRWGVDTEPLRYLRYRVIHKPLLMKQWENTPYEPTRHECPRARLRRLGGGYVRSAADSSGRWIHPRMAVQLGKARQKFPARKGSKMKVPVKTARRPRTLAMVVGVVVALVVAGCSSGGSSGGSVKEIRIGLVFPTSGAFATLGNDQVNGVKMVLDWANKNGGINGVPIKYFDADTQSDPGVGATTAQRLIDKDHVDLLIGSYSSGISQAMLPVAQRNNVVLWEVGSVSTSINEGGNPNFLRTVGSAATYASADVDFTMNYVAAKLGKKPSELRVAIVHEDGSFGSAVAKALEKLAIDNHLNVVFRQSYSIKSADLTPMILALKQAKPDVVYLVSLVADSFLFYDQARIQDFNAPAVIGSSGFSDASLLKRFGVKGVEGAFDVEPPNMANMNTGNLKPEIKKLVEGWLADFEAKQGHPCLVHCGDGVGGAYVLVADVLPRALAEGKSVQASAIVAAAAKTDIAPGGTPQGFGVKFTPAKKGDPNSGDNSRAFATIMQWQSGQLQVIWPKAVANAEPIFPMPKWSQR